MGAATETELKESKLRIEDALNATRAAVEEGIISGGGASLISVIPAVEALLKLPTAMKIQVLKSSEEHLKNH